ncbi:MAG: hypothetical protein QXN17_08320 [Nitrososphaerota archaeon]
MRVLVSEGYRNVLVVDKHSTDMTIEATKKTDTTVIYTKRVEEADTARM